MKTYSEIQAIATQTIYVEEQAIGQLAKQQTDDFPKVVEAILQSDGRVIVTGIGKSAIIASKIVATFNSTGTPAVFMHAADAIHGDLGVILKNDVVICISNSGNTPEIKVLVPMIKERGSLLVALCGNKESYLVEKADFLIDSTVEKEACPNNLAPTSSTTAQLVLGDALAVALLECRGFTMDDFAKIHPGGALGKKLYLKVEDLFVKNEAPAVQIDDDIKNTIFEISSKRLGATAVLKGEKLVGVITDGDLRRMLQQHEGIEGVKAGDIMSPDPKTISPETLVVDALNIMRRNNITQILVTDGTKYAGVIHLHDILKEGIL